MTTIGDIEVDLETHARLLRAQDDGELSEIMPSMLAAITAAMIASLGRDQTSAILRMWADEIEIEKPSGHA